MKDYILSRHFGGNLNKEQNLFIGLESIDDCYSVGTLDEDEIAPPTKVNVKMSGKLKNDVTWDRWGPGRTIYGNSGEEFKQAIHSILST